MSQPAQNSQSSALKLNQAKTHPSSVQYVIDIQSLSKSFKRKTLKAGYSTLKSFFLSGLLAPFKSQDNLKGPQYVEVIKNLTLRIPKGSCAGIIGRNGTGKSTLLKLISGIYKPDLGTLKVTGRIAALIELGAGFHPDFTGRENLLLGGIMHGLTRQEIQERIPKIAEFAELNEVLDDPVRTYSSGMFMRLGFSLAVHTEPDILIVDEVLAVGDEAFQHKCSEKISELRAAGKTLLLVTHDLGAVERWCDEVLWLHEGEVKDRGNPRRVIDEYRTFVERKEQRDILRDEQQQLKNNPSDLASQNANHTDKQSERWGSREIEIYNIVLSGPQGDQQRIFHEEDSLRVEFEYQLNESSKHITKDVVFGIAIRRNDGLVLHGTNTDLEGISFSVEGTSGKVCYSLKRLGLLDGVYLIDVAVHKRDGYPYDYQQSAMKFSVRSSIKQVGVLVPEHSWQINGVISSALNQSELNR